MDPDLWSLSVTPDKRLYFKMELMEMDLGPVSVHSTRLILEDSNWCPTFSILNGEENVSSFRLNSRENVAKYFRKLRTIFDFMVWERARGSGDLIGTDPINEVKIIVTGDAIVRHFFNGNIPINEKTILAWLEENQ